MPTETDTTPSRWNTDTLKEFLSTQINDLKALNEQMRAADDIRYQQRFDTQQKAFTDALYSQERAVLKAEAAAEKRFESVNEFRAVLSSQSATLIPRTEAEGRFSAMNEKIDDIKTRLDKGEGGSAGIKVAREETHMTVGTIVGVVGGITGVLLLLSTILISTWNHPALTPTGIDSKRVDDLIAQSLERNRDLNARLDALSSRINGLQGAAPTPSAPLSR
jgi:hypothetical protein